MLDRNRAFFERGAPSLTLDERKAIGQAAREMMRQGFEPASASSSPPHPRLPSSFDAAKARKVSDVPMLSDDLRRRMGLRVADDTAGAR